MTVAAVILSATSEDALATLEGVARVRHLADAAWSGGAMPVVVVAPDPDGALAAALEGSMAELVAPEPPERGSVGRIVHGMEAAVASVGETTGALVWPTRMAWVDAGTVTGLIEAHATSADAMLRPAWGGTAGWPALLPVGSLDALRRLDPAHDPGELLDDLVRSGLALVTLDLGDPGAVYDVTTPRDALPSFEGPREPAIGHPPEWGASVARAVRDT